MTLTLVVDSVGKEARVVDWLGSVTPELKTTVLPVTTLGVLKESVFVSARLDLKVQEETPHAKEELQVP